MRLVYWIADSKDDRPVYSVRERTRKACLETLRREWPGTWSDHFSSPRKITIHYADGFDLMRQCLGREGGVE